MEVWRGERDVVGSGEMVVVRVTTPGFLLRRGGVLMTLYVGHAGSRCVVRECDDLGSRYVGLGC